MLKSNTCAQQRGCFQSITGTGGRSARHGSRQGDVNTEQQRGTSSSATLTRPAVGLLRPQKRGSLLPRFAPTGTLQTLTLTSTSLWKPGSGHAPANKTNNLLRGRNKRRQAVLSGAMKLTENRRVVSSNLSRCFHVKSVFLKIFPVVEKLKHTHTHIFPTFCSVMFKRLKMFHFISKSSLTLMTPIQKYSIFQTTRI